MAAKLAELTTTAALHAVAPALVASYTFGSAVVATTGSLVTALAAGGLVVLNATLVVEFLAAPAARRTTGPALPAGDRLLGYGSLSLLYFAAAYAAARHLAANASLLFGLL